MMLQPLKQEAIYKGSPNELLFLKGFIITSEIAILFVTIVGMAQGRVKSMKRRVAVKVAVSENVVA